jgi:MFS family permease
VTAEEWVLAATVFLSGLASGLLGMLSAIMRPMLASMDGRDFRSFMEAFLRYAGHSWGKVFNFAWSIGMTIGPAVALVLLWDDRRSTSFVLTAIGLGIVIVGVLIVSNVWGRLGRQAHRGGVARRDDVRARAGQSAPPVPPASRERGVARRPARRAHAPHPRG